RTADQRTLSGVPRRSAERSAATGSPVVLPSHSARLSAPQTDRRVRVGAGALSYRRRRRWRSAVPMGCRFHVRAENIVRRRHVRAVRNQRKRGLAVPRQRARTARGRGPRATCESRRRRRMNTGAVGHGVSFGEATRVWLKIGFLSFG